MYINRYIEVHFRTNALENLTRKQSQQIKVLELEYTLFNAYSYNVL